MDENGFDISDLIPEAGSESREIKPEVDGLESLEDSRVSRYNPFTREFERVPPNWRLKHDLKTREWHFRPD